MENQSLFSTPQIDNAVNTYHNCKDYEHESEWPEWVRQMEYALITGNDKYIQGYLPWVQKVYDRLKSELDNGCISMSDSN